MKTSLLPPHQPLRRPAFSRLGVLAVALQGLAASSLLAQKVDTTPIVSSIVPVDVANGTSASQTDWNNFGWQTFVALNWPSMPPDASGTSGQPDSSQSIGASSGGALIPTTWLTWRTASSTFLPAAADPGPWATSPTVHRLGAAKKKSSLPPLGTGSVAPGYQPMLLDLVSKLQNPNGQNFPIDEINQASGPPLIDQSGWYVIYDIRLNQSEYTYILQNGYYDAVAQQKAFTSNPISFNGFPRDGVNLPGQPGTPMFNPPLPAYAQFGATEVKAAWRVLDPVKDKAVMSRYYTQTGYFLQPDGKTWEGPTVFGLIGFHILRLTNSSPSTWYWATFEQVDNVSVPSGASFNPTLAAPNTTNGSCGANTNVAPAKASGNLPWNGSATPVVNVCRVTSPYPDDIQLANKVWQNALKDTVWANYEMVGVINPAVAGNKSYPVPSPYTTGVPNANTDTLANTTMETYVQANGSSCMNCHGKFGFPQFAPTTSGDYQVFSFLLTDADSSDPAKAKPQGLPQGVRELLNAKAAK